MSESLDQLQRTLDVWAKQNPSEAEFADLDGCEPPKRPSLWRRVLCRFGLCRTLVVIDRRSLTAEPARCIDCGRAHAWLTPERLRMASNERSRRAGLYWMEDV